MKTHPLQIEQVHMWCANKQLAALLLYRYVVISEVMIIDCVSKYSSYKWKSKTGELSTI